MAVNFGQMLQGANSGSYTPETVARRQKMAEALLGRAMGIQNIQHPLQGLAQMLQAGVGAFRLREADEQESAERERANKMMADLLSQGQGADMGALMTAMSDPWTSDASARLGQVLLGENIRRSDPAYQMGLEKMGLELDALRNPKPEGPEYDFQFGPNGELIRTDATGGGIESMGNFADEPEPGFQLLAKEDALAMGLDPSKSWQVGPDNRVYEVGNSGTNVSVNVGDGAPGLGKLSTDFGYVLDPETGKPVIDPATGLPRAAPVPGSPAALDIERAGKKDDVAEGRQVIASDTITNAAAIARGLAAKGGSTGLVGQVLGNLSETDAAELRRQVNTLRSVASIENLTAMRQASPTGAALGSLTERENAMLAEASGAIDPNSKAEDFQRQLDNYERTLLRIVHGPEAGDRIFEETRAPAGRPPGVPEVGAIEDGYRFKGGDPANKDNWELVR